MIYQSYKFLNFSLGLHQLILELMLRPLRFSITAIRPIDGVLYLIPGVELESPSNLLNIHPVSKEDDR